MDTATPTEITTAARAAVLIQIAEAEAQARAALTKALGAYVAVLNEAMRVGAVRVAVPEVGVSIDSLPVRFTTQRSEGMVLDVRAELHTRMEF